MAAHTYSVLIYKSSITSTYASPLSTANVAYSFNQSYLTGIPEPATPVIRPLEGRAEAQSWSVGILDSNSTVTSILADSTGRFHLLNRMIGVRRTVDGSAATWLGVGRIADVTMDPNVASYTLTVDDEHRLARITDIFTTNTTRLYPAGPNVPYGPFPVPLPATFQGGLRYMMPTSSQQAMVTLSQAVGDYDSLVAAVTEDRIPWNEYRGMGATTSRGNYEHLRLRVWNSGVTDPNNSMLYTDCPILGFPEENEYTISIAQDPSVGLTENAAPNIGGAEGSIKNLINALPTISRLRVTVIATTGVVPAIIGGQDAPAARYAMLHAMSKPPSDVTPLHIGGITGKHPAAIAKDVYDGAYSTSGSRLPRYSTSAIGTLKDDGRYPLMRFRVTEGPQPMARWLEDNIYAPNLLAPVTDDQGRIAPKSLLQPQSSGVVGYTLTGANLRAPHPSFTNNTAEQVTVAEYAYTHEMAPKKYVVWFTLGKTKMRYGWRNRGAEPSGYGGDLLAVDSRTIERAARTTAYGRNVVGYAANGWHTESLPDNPNIFQTAVNTIFGNKALPNAQLMSGHLLDRFADGAVTGELHALSTAESVNPGDYVKVSLDSYPNAETNARGGDRIVQVLSKRITPQGPSYTYLDAGPSAQPCTAPTVAVSAGPAGSTKHAINVAIGGISGRAYAQIAFGSTRPPATSTRWEAAFNSTSTAAQTIGSLPSGSTCHVRAWNLKPHRFASAFAYSSKRATAPLAAPSGFATTVTGGNYMTVKWTAGETLPADLYALRTASTSVAFNSTNYVATVGVGTNRYTYTGLTSNSSYTFGIRHRDIYGGLGNTASLHDNTTGANLTAGAVTLAILVGGST